MKVVEYKGERYFLMNIGEIPEWLRESDLAKKISENAEDEEVMVKFEYYRQVGSNIENLKDWIEILNICDFWGATFPEIFIVFYLLNKKKIDKYLNGLSLTNNGGEEIHHHQVRNNNYIIEGIKNSILEEEMKLKDQHGEEWFQNVIDNPEKLWNYDHLLKNPNLTLKNIEKHKKLFMENTGLSERNI